MNGDASCDRVAIRDSLFRGGLGSGVGGLRWLRGVPIEGWFERSAVIVASAKGGGLKVMSGCVLSREFEGGVGGSPFSCAAGSTGDITGVRSGATVEASSSENVNDGTFTGLAAGKRLFESLRRCMRRCGSVLCAFRAGASRKELSSRSYGSPAVPGIAAVVDGNLVLG